MKTPVSFRRTKPIKRSSDHSPIRGKDGERHRWGDRWEIDAGIDAGIYEGTDGGIYCIKWYIKREKVIRTPCNGGKSYFRRNDNREIPTINRWKSERISRSSSELVKLHYSIPRNSITITSEKFRWNFVASELRWHPGVCLRKNGESGRPTNICCQTYFHCATCCARHGLCVSSSFSI